MTPFFKQASCYYPETSLGEGMYFSPHSLFFLISIRIYCWRHWFLECPSRWGLFFRLKIHVKSKIMFNSILIFLLSCQPGIKDDTLNNKEGGEERWDVTLIVWNHLCHEYNKMSASNHINFFFSRINNKTIPGLFLFYFYSLLSFFFFIIKYSKNIFSKTSIDHL